MPYFCRINSGQIFYMYGSFFGPNHYKKPVFTFMRNYKEGFKYLTQALICVQKTLKYVLLKVFRDLDSSVFRRNVHRSKLIHAMLTHMIASNSSNLIWYSQTTLGYLDLAKNNSSIVFSSPSL